MWGKPGVVVFGLLLPLVLVSGDARGQKPVVMVDILKDCVEVRLVGMTVSETRGRHLIAVLETKDKEPRVVEMHFPNHSLSPHEWTLSNLIRSVCTDDGGNKDKEWRKARTDVEIEFMVPHVPPLSFLVDGKPPRVNLKGTEILEKCGVRAVRFKKDN